MPPSRPRALAIHVKWVVVVIVVALALGGSATAAFRISGKDIVNNSVTGKDVRNSSLTGADIRDRSLRARDFRDSIRGPQGPPGPPGLNSLSILSQHTGAPVPMPVDGTVKEVSALCDPGEIAVSGGYLPTPGSGAPILVLGSIAGVSNTTRDGWTVLAGNASGSPGELEAIAYCAQLPPGVTAAAAARAHKRALARLATLAGTRLH